jgi:siroheme synthase-like protein
MRYLPLMADVAGRSCVVVGAGQVALQKVALLRSAGARVSVIAPVAHAELARSAAAGEIDWQRREYRDGDLADAVLAFATTGIADVQERVASEARRRGVWLNAVDEPERCTFVMPAVLEQGSVTIAVGTSGTSPALAAHLRDRVSELVRPEVAACAEHLAELRRRLPPGAARQRALRRLVEDGILEAFEAGDRERIERLTAAATSQVEEDHAPPPGTAC